MRRVGYLFDELIAPANLLAAFREAARGKGHRSDVLAYRYHLEPRLVALRERLATGDYAFGPYRAFRVLDPKPRQVLSAPFDDRIVHHALCRVLEPIFEPTFIFDSYACRPGKGTHAAVLRLQSFLREVRSGWVLKADIRKFFQSVDRGVLLALLARKLKDQRVLDLADQVITSAPEDPAFGAGKGLPIGNLTSQLFANVYLNPLDHFVKEHARERRYVRYVDDFMIVGPRKEDLQRLKDEIDEFLGERLGLALHAHKSQVAPVRSGVGFLGYRVWPDRLRVRTSTLVRLRRKEREARRRYWDAPGDPTDYERSLAGIRGHVILADRNGLLMRRLCE
jgi:retron-type reverse transcriptase